MPRYNKQISSIFFFKKRPLAISSAIIKDAHKRRRRNDDGANQKLKRRQHQGRPRGVSIDTLLLWAESAIYSLATFKKYITTRCVAFFLSPVRLPLVCLSYKSGNSQISSGFVVWVWDLIAAAAAATRQMANDHVRTKRKGKTFLSRSLLPCHYIGLTFFVLYFLF